MPATNNEASTLPAKRKGTYTPTGRPRGRPKGSRAKPKEPVVHLVAKPASMRIPRAAQYLDLSPSTVKKLVRQGRLESIRIGTARLILVRSLDALLEGRHTSPSSPVTS
jgi:excisionase family DNA binding protein